MSDYINKTEQQELEAVKHWFKQHGMKLLIAILLGVAGFTGYQYYKSKKAYEMQMLSLQYQEVLNDEKSKDLLKAFALKNKNNSYGLFAGLEQAKKDIQNKNFADAQNILKELSQNTSDPFVLDILNLRQAQVAFQLKQYEPALNFLKSVKSEAWNFTVLMLQGDILAEKGDTKEAKTTYEKALAKADPTQKIFVEFRLSNL